MLHRRRTVILAALGVQAGLLLLLARDLWFVSDDFTNASVAERNPLTWSWLRSDLYQHLSPGHRLADWLLQAYAPLSWATVLTVMLTLVVVSGLLLHLIVDRLFARPWWTVLVVATWGTSVVVFDLLQWWAAAEHGLFASALGLLAVWAWLVHLQDRARWALPVVAVGLMGALLFYEKAALIPVFLVLLRVLLLQEELRPRALLRGLRRELPVWLALALPMVAYIALYLSGSYGGFERFPDPGPAWEFTRDFWLRALTPGLLGVRVPPGDPSAGQEAIVLVGQLVFWAFVAWTLVRDRRAWRGWAFWAAVVVLNGASIGIPRVPIYGPGTAYELRYLTELMYLWPLVLGAVLAPGAVWRTDRSAPVTVTPMAGRAVVRVPRVPALLGAGALAAHVGLLLWTVPDMERRWPTDAARTYVENLRGGTERALRDGEDFALLNADAVAYVMPGNHPEHFLSDLTLIWTREVRYDVPAEKTYVVGPDGRPGEVRFVPAVRRTGADWASESTLFLSPVGGETTTGRPRIEGARACFDSPAETVALLERDIPVPAGGPEPAVLRVALEVTPPIPVGVLVDRGDGYPEAADLQATDANRAGDRIQLQLGSPGVRKLRFDLQPGHRMCLGDVEIGRFVPVGG